MESQPQPRIDGNGAEMDVDDESFPGMHFYPYWIPYSGIFPCRQIFAFLPQKNEDKSSWFLISTAIYASKNKNCDCPTKIWQDVDGLAAFGYAHIPQKPIFCIHQ